MLYPIRHCLAVGLTAVASLAFAQTRPAKKAAPPPAPVVEAPAPAGGRCNEDDAGLSRLGRDMTALETNDGDPRASLQTLIDRTMARSKALGAVRLMTEAARFDLEETRALAMPTASLSIGVNGIHQSVGGVNVGRGGQLGATLSAGMPLWDGGRIAKLTEWRKELAEVAQQGQRSAEEQLALSTVSLALDRSRYVLQGQVYTQYVRKMACLVDALQIITQADRGRASELVQAQKSLQQADLSLEQTMSALRQTEVRMKRLVGEPLPASIGMTAVLSLMPDLEQMQSDILLGADVAQAEAQARSQRSFAESVIAGQKPTVNLTGSASAMFRGGGPNDQRSTDIGAGVSVTIPILQPGAQAQASAAVQRYRATVLQRDEAIEAKRYRLLEMHEVGTSTLDRARRIVEILRNSDRVRASTLQQWQQLGRRSLFDVMAAEGDYYSMRVAHVNAMFDAQQVVALIWSMGRGVSTPLR
jgi:outer membrane protein, adhesin transport system